MNRRLTWRDALQLHRDAAAEYAGAAEALDAAAWVVPCAEGKWSPAQVTDHLVRAYRVLLAELAGGPGMQIRTRPWQRLLLRLTLMPRLLAGKPFPDGARAPRETRPADSPGDQQALVASFREHAARFDAEAVRVRERAPRQRLTHAYFGRSRLLDGVVFCARHIQHHRRQIPVDRGADGA